jgi:hypothetical protein
VSNLLPILEYARPQAAFVSYLIVGRELVPVEIQELDSGGWCGADGSHAKTAMPDLDSLISQTRGELEICHQPSA